MRLYLINANAPFVPAAWQGGWDGSPPSSSSYIRMIDPVKWALNEYNEIPVAYNTAGTSPFNVAVTRLMSRKLAAQTISGTVDLLARVWEDTGAANAFLRAHLYVTVGDTNAVRGTLLTYDDSASGTEVPTTAAGKAWAAPQALTPVAAQEGDRLVVELGMVAVGAAAGVNTVTYTVGAWGFDGEAYPDLTVGETSATTAGFLDFSHTFVLSATEPTNISPTLAAPIAALPYSQTLTPTFNALELWYAYTPAAATPISSFMGRSATYEVRQEVWRGPIDASFARFESSTYNASDEVYVVSAPAGITTYLRGIPAFGATATGTFTIQVTVVPEASGNLHGYILITGDSPDIASTDQFAYVVNPTTGAIVGVLRNIPPGENGAMLGTAQRWLAPAGQATTILNLYNSLTFALVTTIPGVIVSSIISENTPITASADRFYVAQYRVDLGAQIRLQAIASDGTPGQIWLLAPSGGVGTNFWGLAVTQDNTIAYYTRRATNEPVKRWDLVNDVALPDFISGQASYTTSDVLVLADDTVLVQWRSPGLGGVAYVARYSAAGALIQSYYPQIDAPAAGAFLDHIRQAPDNPTSFWVWLQDNTGQPGVAWFLRYNTETGAVINNLSLDMFHFGLTSNNPLPAGTLPTQTYGIPDSCPLLFILAEGVGCPGTRGAPNIGA